MDIFCRIINGEIPTRKIYEDDIVMVIMDVNPISCGHSLIIPKEHYKDLFDIEKDILDHIMKIAKEMASLFYDKLGCEGLVLEQNNGFVQEVPHFHLHLIPKYKEAIEMDIEDVFHKIVD